MKYTVSDIKMLRRMVESACRQDYRDSVSLLKKQQTDFYDFIKEVGTDPRCLDVYKYCVLYSALAIEMAERMTGTLCEPISKNELKYIAGLVVREDSGLYNRGLAVSDRIGRYVLKYTKFDEQDRGWLMMTLSAFLLAIEGRYQY